MGRNWQWGGKVRVQGRILTRKPSPQFLEAFLFRQIGERYVCPSVLDNRAGFHRIKGKSCPCRCRDNLARSNRFLFVKGCGGFIRNKSRLLETAGFF